MKYAGLLFCIAALWTSQAGAADREVLPKTVTPSHYDLKVDADPGAKSFKGWVQIAITVASPTNDIVLNAADLAFHQVTLSGHKDKPVVAFDTGKQTATLHFAKPIAPGSYSLAIAYTGKINDGSAGLFVREYDSKAGKKKAIYTNFEPGSERLFMPSWDEPAQKATFTVSAVVPQGEMAVSNMPVASEIKLGGGKKEVHFATSPKMSTYLLFFAQGDFARVSKKVGNVEVGVVAKAGEESRSQTALDAAAELLVYYNDYFGTPYPLPKLDLIAAVGHGDSYGAMENWGAIQFFESNLLFDPKLAGESGKRRVFGIVAHEMAHQWFGDLVTMAWWDDLWLNEGFASWMTTKASAVLHPDWKGGYSALAGRDRAMTVDARATTHPVVQEIKDVYEADQAFDDITYEKGESVIFMLEDYLGETAFRDGVRAYMKKHAYGNTVTDDLWAELEAASGQPVKTIAHDFTLKPGVPLIKVSQTASGVRLTLDRFAVDASAKEKQAWHVPVKIAGLDGKPLWQGVVADTPVDVALPKGTIAIVNAGKTGYFRTLYDAPLFTALAANFAAQPAYDQYGFLGDTSGLSSAGFEPVGDHLSLLARVTPLMDAKVQGAAAMQIGGLVGFMRDLPGEATARRYGDTMLAPLLAKLGWEASPQEDGNISVLRGQLIEALGGRIGNAAVLSEAKKRFDGFLNDRASLPGALRNTVLGIVAYHADAADWEKLHQLAKTETNSVLKLQYYELLADAKDPALAAKALALSTSAESWPTLPTRLALGVSHNYPELAFDYATSHLDLFDAQLEKTYRDRFYPVLLRSAVDAAVLPKLAAFTAAHIPPTAQGESKRIKAVVEEAIKKRAELGPAIDTWLKTKCSAATGCKF